IAQSLGGGGGTGGFSVAAGIGTSSGSGNLNIGVGGAGGSGSSSCENLLSGTCVTVHSSAGSITTLGDHSDGIEAQSIGGGGGNGGFAIAGGIGTVNLN